MSVADARRRPCAARIDAAAVRAAARDPSDVTLVAATKTVDAERVRAVVAAGVPDVGENRAQELLEKAPLVDGARWHFVGTLQRNKVRALAPWIACWQSVDRDALGAEIARRAPGRARARRGERRGGSPEGRLRAERGAGPRRRAPRPRPAGGRAHDRAPGGRRPAPVVRGAAGAREPGSGVHELSMGMSGDFEVAVEEGATMVRVGRALFGERPVPTSPERRR